MKVASQYPYNEKWKTKLNWLIDNSTETTACPYSITFKVVVGRSKKYFLGCLFPIWTTKYATYRVWTENKDSCKAGGVQWESYIRSSAVLAW